MTSGHFDAIAGGGVYAA